MVALFLTNIITCSQALSVIHKIKSNSALPEYLKTELIETLRETIPTCPIKVKPDGK
jgi:hypothetical protein